MFVEARERGGDEVEGTDRGADNTGRQDTIGHDTNRESLEAAVILTILSCARLAAPLTVPQILMDDLSAVKSAVFTRKCESFLESLVADGRRRGDRGEHQTGELGEI
jgi:hypothetical protein